MRLGVLAAALAHAVVYARSPRAQPPLLGEQTDRVDLFVAKAALEMSPADGDQVLAEIDRAVAAQHDDAVRRGLHVLPRPGHAAHVLISARADAPAIARHMLARLLVSPSSGPEWMASATAIHLSKGPVADPDAWLRVWASPAQGPDERGRFDLAAWVLAKTPRKRVAQAVAHERAFLSRTDRAALPGFEQLERAVASGPWPQWPPGR